VVGTGAAIHSLMIVIAHRVRVGEIFEVGSISFLDVVSPFSKGGHISHTYTDHVSTLKFIERNWGLRPITSRSRDNLPNPLTASNPYVPVNSPAIGDLFDLYDLYDFDH
jgi:phospholipase C